MAALAPNPGPDPALLPVRQETQVMEPPEPPEVPAPGEEAFSDDPMESACQMEIAIDADVACKTEKGFAPIDHGRMYDGCVRDYQLRMSRCMDEKAKG
jgi:hypothetical protein